MPKTTFENLSDEKKTAIELILINSYSQKPASLVTVSDIIKQADFSRAAFYKYFDDIEDARQYIIRRGTDIAHEEIMRFIGRSRNNFFKGMEKYLIHVTKLDHDDLEYKILQVLIESGNTVMFQMEDADQMYADEMVKPWLKLLELNKIKISEPKEAISFLYFIMALIMDSLSAYMVGTMTSDQLLEDFSYKVKWLTNGLR